jgi:putative ABC transport system permease protein
MVGSALIGCACVLPALLPVLLRAVAWVVPLFLGAEGRLAVRQLMRQRARTGLTVGVLFAALTACLSFGTSFLNNLRDIDVWFAQTIDTPYLVRAVQPDPAVIVTPAPLPAFAVEEIRRLPGCASALKVSFHATRIQEQAALILAREFSADTPLPLSLHAGEPADVLAALARGETVVGSALAARLRVGVGDSITLPGRHGPHRVRIGGIAKEYTVGGMALYLDWEQASRLVGIEHPHALAVTPRPGEEEAFESALTGYCARQGLLLQHNIDFAALIYRVVRGVRVLVVGMVALIFLVAGLGVINTLTTNILDQTRELGILRALGMKRQQLGKLILAQALVLAVVSCLSGTPAGVLLSYLMNLATPGLLGHHVPFRIHTWYVIVCVLGLSVLAVLAALVPARRAARLAVIDALRYE